MIEKKKCRFLGIQRDANRTTITLSFMPSIVFKFPRIYFLIGLERLVMYSRDLFQRETWDYMVHLTPTWCFAKGIIDNWQEYRYYKRNRHPLLEATYFSLFGFINIQKRGRPLGCTKNVFWRYVCLATEYNALGDIDHFANPANFCADEGVRIIDYGSSHTQEIISRYGYTLANTLAEHISEICTA